ncbi:hypothetical protein MRX96_040445 [Rhipicephalus microplus]
MSPGCDFVQDVRWAAKFVFVKIVVVVVADEGPIKKQDASAYVPDLTRFIESLRLLLRPQSHDCGSARGPPILVIRSPGGVCNDRALMFRLDDVTEVVGSWSPRKERQQTGRFRRVSGKVAPTLILISFLRVVVRRANSSARFARASNGNGESLDPPRVESNHDRGNLNFSLLLWRFGAAATVAMARSWPGLVMENERIVSGALVPTTKVAKEYAERYGHELGRARAQNTHREIQPANATEGHQMREHKADACARGIGDDDFHGKR